jgi:hypothetical protein
MFLIGVLNKPNFVKWREEIGIIHRIIYHKIFAFGTFLDIEGAFDNASFNSLVMASLDHGVDDTST